MINVNIPMSEVQQDNAVGLIMKRENHHLIGARQSKTLVFKTMQRPETSSAYVHTYQKSSYKFGMCPFMITM